MMKKIIAIFVVIFLVVMFSVFFVVSSNNNYLDDIEKEILNNYDLKDDIKYLNKSDLYYIILTNKNLVVLDKNYNEILKEDIDNIKLLNKEYEIVYRLNKVMYEVKNVSDNKIVYDYYDIYTNELIDSLQIGG